jgi:transposase
MLDFSSKNKGLEKRMLGRKNRSEKMFYYVKMDDLIPEDHLLRLIHRYVDLGFIRRKVAHLYSHTGRPSIDPEILLRMLLIGYLYGITSERRLCEDVKMHVGYRWFVGLSLDDTVPDHSTFSHNRHDRFAESGLFQDIFDEIVAQCMKHGLVKGTHLTVDATHIKADASFKSLDPVVVEMKPKEYIDTLQKENPVDNKPWEPGDDYPHRGEKISNSTHRSKTDPDARLSRKAPGAGAQLAHSATYVIDNGTSIIVGAEVCKPDLASEAQTALAQILRSQWRFKLRTRTVGADKGYSAGEFIHALTQQRIDPHVPVIDHRSQNDKGIYPLSAFTFDKEHNQFICPEGNKLSYLGLHTHSRQHVYRARMKDCQTCPRKDACTRDRARSLSYHIYEASIEKARSLTTTSPYRISQRMRKRIEELFGEAKELMGFRRAKFRYRRFVREQVLMTAATQNIKRMVKLLSRRAPIREAGVDRAPLSCLWKSLKSLISLTRSFLQGWALPKVLLGWN